MSSPSPPPVLAQIDISQTDITGTLPPTLFVSGTLKKFEAYHAGISGTIPPTIGMARKLRAARAASRPAAPAPRGGPACARRARAS